MRIEQKNLGEPIFNTEFFNYLTAKGLMDRTKNSYMFYLKRLNNITLDNQPTQDTINRFLASNNNRVAHAFLILYLSFSNLSNIVVPKITGKANNPELLAKHISREEINKISDEFDKIDHRKRNKLMLAISFQGALRESELLNLEPKDFDFNNWDETSPLTFKVIGKGNKSRQVFINSDVALTLRHYIEEVKLNLGLNDYNFKLFSNKGNGIGARRWQIILSDISFRAIGKRVHPHMIRHSFAMYAHDELKWTLEMIGKYLGHSSLQVTTIYARTSTKQLSEAFNKDFNKIEDRDE